MAALSFFKELKNYSIRKLGGDLSSAVTVTILLVPQGMAYAMLAGLPPIYGLYAALIPLIVYPIFGSCQQLSIGPVALMSIIVLSGVSLFAEPGSQEYIDLVLMTALLSGIIQIGFSFLRLGVLANFLSQPVMVGFVSAAGVIIAISQIKYLLTLDLPRSASVPEMIIEVGQHISGFNGYSLLLGVAGIIVILLLKRIHKTFPGSLVVVILGSLAIYYMNLNDLGVPIVGELPSGLPSFYAGFWSWSYFVALLPTAFIVSVMCFIGSFSLAKAIAAQRDNYPIYADRELLGLGMAKLVGSFFLAMPSTGSFTRSVVNEEAGAKSGVSSILAAGFVALTLLFFGGLFYYLPEPILAAIVITSVFSLIDVKEARYFFRTDKADFRIFLGTFGLTLVLGIVNGILLGIVFSLLSIIRRAAKPNYAVLGQLPGTASFRNVGRFPEAITAPETLIMRYDQDLFFGNADKFYNTVVTEMKRKPALKYLIINARAFRNMDSTALRKVHQLVDYCIENKVRIILTELSGPMRDLFFKDGIIKKMGPENLHLSIPDAIDMIDQHEYGDAQLSNEYARQTNLGKEKRSFFSKFRIKKRE